MFTRTVPNLLIVAIIVCPLLCRNGLCQWCCSAKGCVSARQSSQSTCQVNGTEHGCCHGTAQDGVGQSDEKRQRPCDDAPCESACQGVCGGAVIEKPNNFPVAAPLWFLPLSDANGPVASLLSDRQTQAAECWFDFSATPGRCIRTLHMSFLC